MGCSYVGECCLHDRGATCSGGRAHSCRCAKSNIPSMARCLHIPLRCQTLHPQPLHHCLQMLVHHQKASLAQTPPRWRDYLRCSLTLRSRSQRLVDGEAVDVATLKQALLLIKKQEGTSSGAGLPARSQSLVAQGGSFLEEPSLLFRKLEPPSASAHASLEAGPPKTKASPALTLLAHDATALYEAAELQHMQLRSSALHAVPLKTEAARTETVKEEHVKREQAFEQPAHAPALPSAAVASAATAPPPLVGEPSSASGVGAGSVLLPPPPAAPEGPQPVPPTLAAQTTLAETTVPTRPILRRSAEPKRLAEKARCEELPLLSEEAQAQYKGWWAGFRKRSVSFGSLNDGSTGSSRDDLEGPAAPAAPAVAATPAAATATATPAHPLPADLPTSASLAHPHPPAAELPTSSPARPPAAELPTSSPARPLAAALPTAAAPALPPVPAPVPTHLATAPVACPPRPVESLPGPSSGPQVEMTRANSSSHPGPWKRCERFLVRNPHCKELCAAWEKGGDCKLAIFAKFVASGERGLELECCMKLKKSKEVEENDKTKYKTWDKVLDHFQNDLDRARRFVAMRRGQGKGPLGLVSWRLESARCLQFTCVPKKVS